MHPSQYVSILFALLLAPAPSSASLHCENMLIDKVKFDMKKLGGPHSVVTSWSESEKYHNTTYTLDICKPLKKSGKGKSTEECPVGTWACAITHELSQDKSKEEDTIQRIIPIAGTLENAGGSQFDPKLERLKTSDSEADAGKEGLRLTLTGGKFPTDVPMSQRREQKAVIEFLCDPDKEGTEGEWEAEDKYEDSPQLMRRAADDKGDDDSSDDPSSEEHQLKKDGAALIWDSYGAEKDVDVLRLTWYTKHACENQKDSGDDPAEDTTTHWGFFTWFVIIVFLGIAAYLIFGSWLNYNRYGARGWDLLPHGDTIRDIPYLLKDWTRRVLNTVQGAGSRGGYSAV